MAISTSKCTYINFQNLPTIYKLIVLTCMDSPRLRFLHDEHFCPAPLHLCLFTKELKYLAVASYIYIYIGLYRVRVYILAISAFQLEIWEVYFLSMTMAIGKCATDAAA